MKKIIGIEETIGEYQGSKYHNINFHCSTAFKNEKSAGFKVSTVKVKYDTLIENLGKALTTAEILAFVGKNVEFYYNEYKTVNFVNIDTTQTATKDNADSKA